MGFGWEWIQPLLLSKTSERTDRRIGLNGLGPMCRRLVSEVTHSSWQLRMGLLPKPLQVGAGTRLWQSLYLTGLQHQRLAPLFPLEAEGAGTSLLDQQKIPFHVSPLLEKCCLTGLWDCPSQGDLGEERWSWWMMSTLWFTAAGASSVFISEGSDVAPVRK